MKILVLDGHSPASLAVVRSLVRRRLSVDTGWESASFSLCRYSRYPGKKLRYPSAEADLDGFYDFFQTLLRDGDYDLVLPVTDRTIVPFHSQAGIFRKFPSLLLPAEEALEASLDKQRTLNLSDKLGIPIPRTFSPENRGELEKCLRKQKAAGFRCPAVIKARRSKMVENNRLISDSGPLFAETTEEMVAAWETKHREIPRPLIQEYIPGDGYGIFGLMKSGDPRVLFAHHRLREEEPTGARSSYCESVALPPAMTESALKLLQSLKWTGPAMVEFKLDRRDGIPRLMEINGRFWGSLPLAIAAGVDFPFLYYRMLREDPTGPQLVAQGSSPAREGSPEELRYDGNQNVAQGFSLAAPAQSAGLLEDPALEGSPAPTDYKIGLKARYLYADIRNLLNVLRGSPYDWMEYPTRWRAIRDFATAFFATGKYFNLDWRDPLPGMFENARFIFRSFMP